MTLRTIILLLLPSVISAQNISSFEAQDGMCTVMILEANDSCIYRIGVEGLGNDHIKKTSYNGKELASRKLNDTKNKVRLRGAYIRNRLIHALIADDSDDLTKLKLSILDLDLNLVEEKLIYKGPLIGNGWKAKTFFGANENGFVMMRDYTKNDRVWLNTFIYNFETGTMSTSEIDFKASSKQEIIDIDFSEDLQLSIISSYFSLDLGTHKTKDLMKMDTYLIHAGNDLPLVNLKLNEENDYTNRSFNCFFQKNKLQIASLKFKIESNVFEGYFIRSYNRSNSNLSEVTEDFYAFDDYPYRDEWGISKNEVSKEYEKDKDRKNSKNSHLANLHIGNVTPLDDDNLLLTLREAQYYPDFPLELFKGLQVVKLDSKSKTILWWNRLLNAPQTGKEYGFRHSIQNPLWNSIDISTELISMTPFLKSNELTLIYGTFNSLYEDNKLIQDKEVKQGGMFGSYSLGLKMIGRTKVNLKTGAFTNDLILDEAYGKSNSFSHSHMNIEGFCYNKGKVFIPFERPTRWKSNIIYFPL